MANDGEYEGHKWQEFYDRIRDYVLTLGTEGIERTDDCWIDDDYLGRYQTIYVVNLKLLSPEVVYKLRAMVSDYPGWEIIVTVCSPGLRGEWPEMGLTIRPHEIIDGLQRQYFPPEFRDLAYAGSRPGTALD